jgi:hypothetical protein
MNKTQLLSDTKNLLYFREKSLIMKQCYWYSNDGTLVLEMENNGNKWYFLHASFW